QEPWLSGRGVHARADHGVLELQGLVASQAERAGVVAMARAIPGCTRVEDHVLVCAEGLRRSWRFTQGGGYTTGRGRAARSRRAAGSPADVEPGRRARPHEPRGLA